MKIAIVVYRLEPNRGGAERWTSDYVDWLRKRHCVTLLTSRATHNLQNLAGISQQVFSSRDRFEFAQRVSHEVDRSTFDVVHDMGYGFNSDVFQPHCGSQIAIDRCKRELHSALSKLGRQLLKSFSRRQQKLTALADKQFKQTHTQFVAVSERVSNDLHQLHAIPMDRISMVHNSVDTGRFHPNLRCHFRRRMRQELQIGDNEFVLLTVAHNHRLKGVPALLKLAQAKFQRPLHVVVVGGANKKPCRSRVNHSSQVTFTGAVTDVQPYYGASDAFVLLSKYDACSLTVLESMASGLPTITTRVNGASELIDHECNGLIANDGQDTAELQPLVKVCMDAGEADRLGRAARATMERYTQSDNFKAIESLYYRIGSSRRMAA